MWNPIKKEIEDWKQIGKNLQKENLQKFMHYYATCWKEHPIRQIVNLVYGFLIVAIIVTVGHYVNNEVRHCDIVFNTDKIESQFDLNNNQENGWEGNYYDYSKEFKDLCMAPKGMKHDNLVNCGFKQVPYSETANKLECKYSWQETKVFIHKDWETIFSELLRVYS